MDGQFAGRADDEGAEAVVLGPSFAGELLEDRDQEGKRLSAAGLGGSKDIFALKGEGDRGALDVGEDFEVGCAEAFSCGLAEGEVIEGLEIGGFGVLLNRSTVSKSGWVRDNRN